MNSQLPLEDEGSAGTPARRRGMLRTEVRAPHEANAAKPISKPWRVGYAIRALRWRVS